MGRTFIKTSGRQTSAYPYCWHGGPFYKWRVYIGQSGYVNAEFIGKSWRGVRSIYCHTLKQEITFDDPKDWDRLVEDMMKELYKQKKKSPDKWKEQKTQCIRSINQNKEYNYQIPQKEKVKEWMDFVLPLARKRK